MSVSRYVRRVAVWLAGLSVVAPADLLHGARRGVAIESERVTPISDIVDVSLMRGGVLAGRVVDAYGQGLLGVPIAVERAGSEVASAVTDESGNFRMPKLGGGVYQVLAGQTGQVVRLWSPGTAPPSAHDQLLVVGRKDTVLGQAEPGPLGRSYESMRNWMANPLIVGAIVAAAVAIPVAVHNARIDRDSGS